MLSVILDVNVLISALITKGKPRELWLKGVIKEFNLVSSNEILADFIRVVSRPKFKPYVKSKDLEDFLKAFHANTSFVEVKSKLKVVREDPDDDIILAAAYDGKVRHVISGDKHLLDLREFRRIRIVTVDEMLKILKARNSEAKILEPIRRALNLKIPRSILATKMR